MLDRLKALLDAEPFVPFRFVMTSGSTYDVQRPYQVAIGQTQLDYFFPRSDRTAMLRFNQLVALETLDTSRPRAKKK